MSADGAHQGISADRAIETIIGGKPEPGEDEQMSLPEFAAYVEAAPDSPGEYGDCARLVAKLVLRYLLSHPADALAPMENEYDPRAWKDPEVMKNGSGLANYVTRWGLYERIKIADPETHAKIQKLGITGFQWGWGVNAARRLCELPPQANPAILTVETAS
jgi:hypothetical protein